MGMQENIPWEKLARYFAGELTMEEKRTMENWIESDPERKELIRKLHNIWKESETMPYQLDVDAAWKALKGNMERLELRQETVDHSSSARKTHLRREVLKLPEKDPERPGRIGRLAIMIAASVLITLTAGFFTHYYHFELQEAEAAEEIAREELTTRDGERAVYTLNDGSRVFLHAGSRLEVPVNFHKANRELYLEGEAYFEVEPDREHPFVVYTGDAYTRVLGTKFLVQSWPDEGPNVEVIVEEGKVALGETRARSASDQSREVIVTRYQKGVWAAGAAPAVHDITDLHWHLGWTEGRLVFEDRQLGEILPRLERWYAVEMKTQDSRVAESRLTAEIDYTQPMMEVVTGIALSLDLEIDKQGRIITFRFPEGN